MANPDDESSSERMARALAKLEEQLKRLRRDERYDRMGLSADDFEDDDDDGDDPHRFYEGEQHDLRATDRGWQRFLKAHAELDGALLGPSVNMYGDVSPLRWYWRASDTPRLETLLAALDRAFKRNSYKPVTHNQIGEALWGEDTTAVASGSFCGSLYAAAKRSEIQRFPGKPTLFAPIDDNRRARRG